MKLKRKKKKRERENHRHQKKKKKERKDQKYVYLKGRDSELTKSVDVRSQDIVLPDLQRLFVRLRVEQIVHLLVVDLHVRDFDFVGELRALLLRDHVEEVVAQPWYNTFVLAASHHRVRFPGPFKRKTKKFVLQLTSIRDC